MNKKKDKIIGKTFHNLTVIDYAERSDKYKNWGGPFVRCKCSCGNEIVVPLSGIEKGIIKSCGCHKGKAGGDFLKKYYETHEPPNSVYLTVNGETRNISEWSRLTGIPRTTIMARIKNKIPSNQLFTKERINSSCSN